MRFRHVQKDQRGQALVFSLITMTIIILVMVSMYSVGQQSINKMRLQNTADAAAYSAVLAEARDYNFAAYTNRAVIANQVAVAQVVGLTSWSRNLAATYDGPASFIPSVLTGLGGPVAKATWDIPAKAYKPVTKAFRSTMNSAAPITVKVLDGLIDILSVAQTVYHYGTALTVAQTIGLSPAKVLDKLAGVDESSLGAVKDLLTFNEDYNVIKINDATADLSTPGTVAAIAHLAQWFAFTQKKDPHTLTKDGANADRMAQVTVASLDDFSRDRSTRGGGPSRNLPEMMYPLPSVLGDLTRLIPYQNGALLMYLWHRGGTELKNINNGKKVWSAMDGTGFVGLGIFWISILGIPIPIPIPLLFVPMGWGAAQAGPQDGVSKAAQLSPSNNFGTAADKAYGGVYRNVHTVGAAGIQRGQGAGTTLDTRAGLRTYFDVKKVEAGKETAAPSLILEVEKAGGAIPSSNRLSGGRFALSNGTQDGYMRALTKAEVYFSRPKKLWGRGDKKTELSSLYSPYWQARLMPNNFAERYASMSFHLW